MPQKLFPRSPDVQSNWIEAVSFSDGTFTLMVWNAEYKSVKYVTVRKTPGLSPDEGAVLIGMDLHKRGLAVPPICLQNLKSFIEELV